MTEEKRKKFVDFVLEDVEKNGFKDYPGFYKSSKGAPDFAYINSSRGYSSYGVADSMYKERDWTIYFWRRGWIWPADAVLKRLKDGFEVEVPLTREEKNLLYDTIHLVFEKNKKEAEAKRKLEEAKAREDSKWL